MKVTVPGAFALLLLAGSVLACSSTDSSAAPTSTTTTSTTTTTTPSSTSLRTITEVEFVPAPELASPGSITIGTRQYELMFECYSEGAGDVLALGVGTRNGRATDSQAIVQAFVGSPYVAVVDGDEVYELAIDRRAELFVQSSVISGSALRFVVSGDVPGLGEPAGLGSVSISCQGFAFGYPDGFPVVTEDT